MADGGFVAGKSFVAQATAEAQLGVVLAIPDFPILRIGFRTVIDAQPDMAVVGEANRAGLAVELDRTGATVVVVEREASHADGGLDAVARLRLTRPAIRILVIDSRWARGDRFSEALRAGANGLLTREARPSDVVAAIRSVDRGRIYVSPAIVSQLVNRDVLGGAQRTIRHDVPGAADG